MTAGCCSPPPTTTPTTRAQRSERPLFTARGLTVRYGEITAVDAVDLAVETGTLVGVTGPSGAGKSSLLRALGGLLPPSAGSVDPAAGLGSGDRSGVAYLPQDFGLVRILTAWENVGVTAVGGRSAALAALGSVGLEDAADHLVDELSGGQRQRVAVARVLARRGALVLADEPTTELDAGNRERVLALLRAEADDGAAVIVTGHDPESMAGFDRVLHLHEGALR